MQVIDINTCMPLHGARVDIWHANATGDYDSNRNGFLRGWQPTSPHGTVDFDTNFPGHYSYRASHIHVVVRIPNQQRVAHVGQIYFDQWLRDQLEVLFPIRLHLLSS
jgi:protocatechuate 3,4-dioxygenase beta subunit